MLKNVAWVNGSLPRGCFRSGGMGEDAISGTVPTSSLFALN
jgi:hypothetical protein